MESSAAQRQRIHQLTGFNKELKERLVTEITGDHQKTSTTDLSYNEAQKLVDSLTQNWGFFDRNNGKHMYILSLLRQLGWTKTEPSKRMEVADIDRLSDWLKSMKSPVNKPLKSMEPFEVSKIIAALEAMTTKQYA